MPKRFWHTQAPNWKDCCNTCKRMIKQAEGYVPASQVQLLLENRHQLVAQKTQAAGLAKLDNYLARKVPVMIGVHYAYGTTYNQDKTTEHFVVMLS